MISATQANTAPSWVQTVAIPAFFTLLGAVLGFVTSLAKEWMNERSRKRAFLEAIKLELTSLKEQLAASHHQVTESVERSRTVEERRFWLEGSETRYS